MTTNVKLQLNYIQWNGKNISEIEEFLDKLGYDCDTKILKNNVLNVFYKLKNGIVWDYPYDNIIELNGYLYEDRYSIFPNVYPFSSLTENEFKNFLKDINR